MSDFTDADYERMAKWCERPDGTVPYNAICRLFESLRPLRAQVATLTAERNRLSTLWGESQAEIARVKALVADAPSAGFQYRLGGIGTWNQASQCTVDECKKFNSENPHLPQFETREVIARPNLEQKP